MYRTIQDPASQRLTWYKPPLTVLVIKKVRDAQVIQPFLQLIHWLILEKRMVVFVEASALQERLVTNHTLYPSIKVFSYKNILLFIIKIFFFSKYILRIVWTCRTSLILNPNCDQVNLITISSSCELFSFIVFYHICFFQLHFHYKLLTLFEILAVNYDKSKIFKLIFF